jgi:cell division protein FtsW (lipid II flippase)
VLLALIIISSFPYVRERFDAFLNPDADTDGRNATYQVKNALTSVGAGGFWGK